MTLVRVLTCFETPNGFTLTTDMTIEILRLCYMLYEQQYIA